MLGFEKWPLWEIGPSKTFESGSETNNLIILLCVFNSSWCNFRAFVYIPKNKFGLKGTQYESYVVGQIKIVVKGRKQMVCKFDTVYEKIGASS